MNESSIGAYDFGPAMSAVVLLGCLVIVARQIILRPSWRQRVHWVAFFALVYVAVLAAFSRLAVAGILTTLMIRTLMALWDRHKVLRVAAVGQHLHFRHAYQVLIKQIGEWIREPGPKWITVVLAIILAVFAIWEPGDSVLTPRIMNFVSAPTRYVSAWWLAADTFMLAVAAFLVETENSIEDFGYAASFAAVVFCALLLLSSRPALSALAVLLIIIGIVHLSTLKFRRTATNLHAYDFIYLCRNYSDVAFWLKNERADAFPLFLTIFSATILLAIVGLSEPSATDRRVIALVFLLAVAAFAIAKRFRVCWARWGGTERTDTYCAFRGNDF